jgi:hypothetical protein
LVLFELVFVLQLLESDSFVTSLGSKSPDVLAFLRVEGRTEALIELVVAPSSPAEDAARVECKTRR